jgi:glucose/arabinose dehydrogenase
MGMVQDNDGSLIVTDDSRGRVYRIRYVGEGEGAQ